MITISDHVTLEHGAMGLFETKNDWIHPTVTVDTHELIYGIDGELKIFEEDERFTVRPGDLLFLEANRLHGGFDLTKGHTSFYWLHFKTSDLEFWNLPKLCKPLPECRRSLREIIHDSLTDRIVCELSLAKLMLELRSDRTGRSKTAHEIKEYIRINADTPLTVAEVARRFEYSVDHVSKLYKNEFGESLKTAIIGARLNHIDSMLLHTNHSIKEIAAETGFACENDFLKFYKYNKRTTPSRFRNTYFRIKMNSR